MITQLKENGFITTGTSFNENNDNLVKLDVRDIGSIKDIVSKIKPEFIINCSANIQIDLLESDPKLAFSTNSEGAGNIAKISQKYDIRLIHVSTDAVFDGSKGMYTEEDIPNPINIYAKSKVLAEKLIQENCTDYAIIRTNFYGYDKKNRFLFNWIVNKLKQNETIVGFSDVVFTPLEASNLTKIILDIAQKEYCGIIHVASNEVLSKYQFALKIAEIFEFDMNLIRIGSVDDHSNFAAKRPKNTSLSNGKLREISKVSIVSLDDWLIRIRDTMRDLN